MKKPPDLVALLLVAALLWLLVFVLQLLGIGGDRQ